jgi:hypothetical protein
MQNLNATVQSLFQSSVGIFWEALPPAMLLAMLSIYASGEISGARFENLFRRIFIAIALLSGFHQISSLFLDLETYLVQIFGGDDALVKVFAHVGDKASEIKDGASGSWIKIGQIGLSIISTLSFLILAVVKRFLDVLHLTIWNLLHVLGPIALLGCLSPSFTAIPKGIFLGMLEICLWKPFWVILGRILLAIGFNETPTDPSQWFDTAVMNFAIAGLMVSVPALVHGFLSGQLASTGGSAIQTMVGGAGVAMSRLPMAAVQKVASTTKNAVVSTGKNTAKLISKALTKS